MHTLELTLFHWAVRLATSKTVPQRYSLSDEPGKRYDFTYFRVYEEQNGDVVYSFLSKGYDKNNGLTGVLYDDFFEEYSEACLPFSKICEPKYDIIRIYRNISISYDKPFHYILGELLRIHIWRYCTQRRSQETFNKKFQFRAERMGVLEKIVDHYKESWAEETFGLGGDHGLDLIYIFSTFYTDRIWGHPSHKMFLCELEFVLDSLVESGDLSKQDLRYMLEPKALQTLSAYAEEEKKHQEFETHNKSIRILTTLLAAAALLQVLLAIFN